jgi:puromycin-sensitive aminopeptidase
MIQCEPCNARQVFPCWDQPTAKATFQLTVIVPSYQMALSNSPLESELLEKTPETKTFIPPLSNARMLTHLSPPVQIDLSKKIYRFTKTLKMSTYMFAFMTGEYDFIEDIVEVNHYKDQMLFDSQKVKIPIRIYTPIGRSHEAKFAMRMAHFALQFFTDKFKLTNPLPKIDFITVDNLPVLGSENWGTSRF